MKAAVFYNGSPYCANMEDVLHCRAVLIQVKIGERSKVGLVVNTSRRHHRKKPMPLPRACRVRLHTGLDPQNVEKTFDNRVARFDFSKSCCILLMYNTVTQQFDKVGFADNCDTIVATLTLKNPIEYYYRVPPQFEIHRFLLAGVFTGDLDFLATFLGHQGASTR